MLRQKLAKNLSLSGLLLVLGLLSEGLFAGAAHAPRSAVAGSLARAARPAAQVSPGGPSGRVAGGAAARAGQPAQGAPSSPRRAAGEVALPDIAVRPESPSAMSVGGFSDGVVPLPSVAGVRRPSFSHSQADSSGSRGTGVSGSSVGSVSRRKPLAYLTESASPQAGQRVGVTTTVSVGKPLASQRVLDLERNVEEVVSQYRSLVSTKPLRYNFMGSELKSKQGLEATLEELKKKVSNAEATLFIEMRMKKDLLSRLILLNKRLNKRSNTQQIQSLQKEIEEQTALFGRLGKLKLQLGIV